MPKINYTISEKYITFFSVMFLLLGIIFFEFSTAFYSILSILLTLLTAMVFKEREFVFSRYILSIIPIYLLYSGVKPLIGKIHSGKDYDLVLINIDKKIFGVNPTEILYQISSPLLTEILQISYFLFFIFFLVQGLEYLIKKDNYSFHNYVRNIIFAFLFSYMLYLFIPAIGPRFSIHEFSKLSSELPGLFFTETIRNLINYGGGIQNPNLPADIQVNRDCMPSGHTMMTIINIVLAFRFKSRFRYLFLVLGCLLIFGTVYLRYHYVIDIIVGLFFAFVSLLLERKIFTILAR